MQVNLWTMLRCVVLVNRLRTTLIDMHNMSEFKQFPVIVPVCGVEISQSSIILIINFNIMG